MVGVALDLFGVAVDIWCFWYGCEKVLLLLGYWRGLVLIRFGVMVRGV